MTYYITRTIPIRYEDAITHVENALREEGFGVITRIDVQDTLKKKINVDFHPYIILGACNPALAYEALQLENKVGTMLPCNVVVQQTGPTQSEVAAIDPVASMKAIDNPALQQAARKVRESLARAIDRLA